MKNFFLKILILTFSAAVLLPEGVFAQKDSLDNIFDGYIKKYEEYFASQPYVSSRYADSARRFAANNVMDSLTVALSYRCCGRIKYITRKYQESLQYQLRAYKIYVKLDLQDEIAASLVDIARIYYAQELYDLAQEYCLNVIEICNKNDLAEIKADAYCVLGRVAVKSGSGFNEAVFNMKYARSIYDSLNLSDKIFDINAFLARAYIYGNAYDSAMKYLNMNFDEYRQAAQKGKIGITYNTCGDIYFETEDYNQALQYYRTAGGIFEECGMVYSVMSVKYNIAKVYFHNGRYDNAARVADTLTREIDEYEKRFKTKEYSLRHKVYSILYNSYLKLDNRDSALKYCELYARGGDSIFIVKNNERVIDFFISMEGHRQQDELLQENFRKEKTKLEDAKLGYRRICFILIGVIGLIIIGFLVFWHWYRLGLTENKALNKANALLDKEIQERKRTEADLKSSEEKYRFVFRKMPVGIIQFNEKLVVTSVNDACMQILGIKNKSLIGINVTTVLPPKMFDDLRSLGDEKDDTVIKHELDLKTPDGEVFVEAVLKSYYYNSGVDVGRAGIIMIQDITERKKEEQNEEGRFATVKNTFDMLPDAVFRLDEKADYIFAKIPGLSPEKQQSYLGRNLRAMTDGSLMIKFLVAFNNVKKTGEQQFVEYQSETSPDKLKEARFSLCLDNTILLTIREINKDKQAEGVNVSAVKADREAGKADTEFINGMSTELKEPLEVILRSCEILAAKSTDAEFSGLLKKALNAASYANETLSDVLKLSKAGGSQENASADSVNPVSVAEDVFNIFQQRAAEKKLEYKFAFSETVPCALEMDEIRVRQILFNLLSNAVKYTEEGGVYLFVSAKNTAPDRTDLIFEVRDTGKGLNGVQLEELFSGSGIRRGLVISKKMADSMKATIEVKSQEGDGSVFILTVPNLLTGGLDGKDCQSDDSGTPLAKKQRNQDVLKEYISVIKYAVIPEFKSLKTQVSFKELSDFANRFREQSVNCNMEKGVEIADKMITDIKNYDISNIIVDSKKIERYIQDLVK